MMTRRFVLSAAMSVFLSLLLKGESVPSYNLTQIEVRIVTTWLFEPNGYLDFAVRVSDGQSARQALALDPLLDVTQWIRDNPQDDPVTSTEVGMVWWIRANDQVNIPVPQRPAEAATWAAILKIWDESITTGLGRVGMAQRNNTSITTFDETGQIEGSIPAGSHLAQQQQMVTKVLGVLE